MGDVCNVIDRRRFLGSCLFLANSLAFDLLREVLEGLGGVERLRNVFVRVRNARGGAARVAELDDLVVLIRLTDELFVLL